MKKKLLYLDLLSPMGHIDINKIYINNFSKIYEEIIVIVSEIYKGKLSEDNYTNVKFKYISNKLFKKDKLRINHMRLFIKILPIINSKYDNIFISSFDNISFKLFFNKINKKMNLLLHENLDIVLISERHEKYFKRIVNNYNINIIVYDEKIRKKIFEIYKDVKCSVSVNLHPIDNSKRKLINRKIKDEKISRIIEENSGKRVLFSPGIANIKAIHEEFKNNIDKLENEWIVICRSKIEYFKKGTLLIYNNNISDEDYATLFSKSDLILLNYSPNYYRVSGVLCDSIAFNKMILVPKKSPVLNSYVEEFNIGYSFSEDKEIISSIRNISENLDYSLDMKLILKNKFNNRKIMDELNLLLK